MAFYRFAFILLLIIASILQIDSRPAEDKETSKDPAVICKLPKERGICRALKKSWAYNAADGKCEEFNYGGCRGNANNFQTEAECKKVCGGQT